MESHEIARPVDTHRLRQFSLIMAVVAVVILLVQILRCVGGHGHWNDLLPSFGILMLFLANAFETWPKYVLQFVGGVILIAAIIMLTVHGIAAK